MRRITLLAVLVLALAGLTFTGCDSMWSAPERSGRVNTEFYLVVDTTTTTLWAGQNINAGTVKVWNDQTDLYVRYNTAAGWSITETHLAVATSLAGIPQTRNGNPIPGRFPYSNVHNPAVTEFTYTVALGDLEPGDELYIAAHCVAELRGPGGELIRRETGWGDGYPFPGRNWATYLRYTVQRTYKDVTLPTGWVRMRGYYPNAPYSYWNIELGNVPTGYDVWNGYWNGWCAERYVYMYPGVWYDVRLWSTCNPNLPERCQNDGWDNVNYVLNHKHANATYVDVEEAIWYLLGNDPNPPTDPEALWMVEQATLYGDGWRPSPGDWIAVIMESADNVQLCFIEVDP
jgi:hypothetical protein